jgi:TPR repeat protein
MKAAWLVFTLLFFSSAAVFQSAAEQTKADQKPLAEVRSKAEAGDADSQSELGLRYVTGEGVAKDPVEAVKWYRKAAEQNYAKAQYNLGVCYASGTGVVKDEVEAVKWFRKVAEQNHPWGQYALGLSYASGEGSGGGSEVVSQSRRAEFRGRSIQFGRFL